MNPADPWVIPPEPTIGDLSKDTTFAAVGRALTAWEEFEAMFASFFAGLVATEDNNPAAVRAYGSVITFRRRAEMVKAAAEGHFGLFPDVDQEKQFLNFINELSTRAAARRNEIAHGVVRELIKITDGELLRTYCLQPPYYATNKNPFKRIEITEGKHFAWYTSKYVYSSVEINDFATKFRGLLPRTADIIGQILEKRSRKP